MPASPSLVAVEVDHALVRCPSCGEQARVDHVADGLRLTCGHCGRVATEQRRSLSLEGYNAARLPFDAPLWLSAECCGSHRLWAVNGQHLDYLTAYIAETQRDRAFPSPSGNRQLADTLPAWMKEAKHRDELLRTLSQLRETL
jgi:ribosomal protein S27AE